MKAYWLRGLFLGASIALLLAAGVALADGLTVTGDKVCVECLPRDTELREVHTLRFTIKGVVPGYHLCQGLYPPSDALPPRCLPLRDADPETGIQGELAGLPCEPSQSEIEFSPFGAQLAPAGNVDDWLGEWRLEVWQTTNLNDVLNRDDWIHSDALTWLLGETCEEEFEEFVPEPGTVVLLGSGLAGLGVYAALRWRTRG